MGERGRNAYRILLGDLGDDHRASGQNLLPCELTTLDGPKRVYPSLSKSDKLG
jgi:hypothetical protein